MPAEQTIGDPDCICAGTGLVCRLGPDSKPDPESIAVCECVPTKVRREERERLQKALLQKGPLGEDEAGDAMLAQARLVSTNLRNAHGDEKAWLFLDTILLYAFQAALDQDGGER